MKTMGKIITGVLIISVIYMYIKNTKKETKEKETKDVCLQTESIYMDIIRDELLAEEKLDLICEDSEDDVIPKEDEYIQKEESQIEEVENLSPENGLISMSVIELKELAKQQNVKGFSRMKKSELIEILS